jgi:hypothetical protein
MAPRSDAPRRPGGRVRRPVVRGAGEHLREDDGQDDLARRLRMRAPGRLGAQGDQEQGAEVMRHRHMVAKGEDGRSRRRPPIGEWANRPVATTPADRRVGEPAGRDDTPMRGGEDGRSRG